jgi:hypothetical protein
MNEIHHFVLPTLSRTNEFILSRCVDSGQKGRMTAYVGVCSELLYRDLDRRYPQLPFQSEEVGVVTSASRTKLGQQGRGLKKCFAVSCRQPRLYHFNIQLEL